LLAHGLRPPALDTIGLNLTMEALFRDFAERTQLLIQYTGCDVGEISDAMNICLYRVLQEALTNIVKHAAARRVDASLTCADGNVKLIVIDDGRGFAANAQHLHDQLPGIGLLGMRERLELLGGGLDMDSTPGQGLRLTATLPLVVPS
jgi:signal transduction histidine kinase